MRRTADWSEHLAKQLQDIEFARGFVVAHIEEGYPIQDALIRIVRAYGVKEYAKRIHMAPSNLLRALDSSTSNLTTKTLSRILKPLGLELTVKRTGAA